MSTPASPVENVPGDDYVVVAKITTVYGVKGWVKVHSFTDPISNFIEFPRCFYRTEAGWQVLPLLQCQRHGKGIVAQLEGVEDRDAARRYCGLELAVPIADLPPLGREEFYWHQLLGLKVISEYQQQSLLLGTVADMLETGANDVLVVRPCQGSVDGRERLLPYLPEQCVLSIDLSAGEMRVDWDPDF